ncbi:MAG: NDP-sugar synthase [Thermoplasmata archaeon]
MKAVILSGGFGTRMRPLTYTTPKPLLPVMNKPLIQHVVDALPDRVDEVILASNYKIERLREYFQDNEIPGKAIHVVDEPKPMGTGGAVKNVEEYLDDTFFVINADIISSIDMEKYLKFFEERDGVGAISAWDVKNPEEFGIFELDDNGRILRFEEKPNAWEAFSNTINAGHYILEPDILDMIPKGEKVSMEREIFPQLVGKGFYGYKFTGYWIDCGRPSSFLKANRTLLELHEREHGVNHIVGEKSYVEGEPGKYVSIGMDCTIEDCDISNSIILDGVEVDEGAVIENSILGYDVNVEGGSRLKGCVVADGLLIDGEHTDEKIRESD